MKRTAIRRRTGQRFGSRDRALSDAIRSSSPIASRVDRKGRTIAFVFGVTLILSATPAASEPYRLGPQDKIRIKIIEWRAGKSEYQEWTPLNAEYVVNTAGAVSVPLVGEVMAADKTTDEVAAAISDDLQKRAGLVSRPDTAVEVVQFRPVYVVGEVERPGEYAYRPHITALQVLSLAGGMHRISEAGLIRLERDRIVATGTFEGARLDLRRNLARRARLEAELDGAAEIRTPPELQRGPDTSHLLAEETAVMKARRDALQSQLTALSELKELYVKEVVSLGNKMTTQEKQISLARRELKNVGALVEKGLAVSSREFTLERTVAELEARMLDLETVSLRAKQEIRKAERDAVDLLKDRKAKIVAEKQDTQANIEQLTAKLNTSQALVDEAAVTAPRLALERSATSARTIVLSIVRRTGGKSIETRAEENTPLEPGDVLRVETIIKSPQPGDFGAIATGQIQP